MKHLNKSKIKQLSIYSNKGKGLIAEAVIAKVRKLEIVCIKLDNFNSKFISLTIMGSGNSKYEKYRIDDEKSPEPIAGRRC